MKVRVFFWLLFGWLLLSRAATLAQTPAVTWQKIYGDPVNQEFAYASARLGPDLYVHGGRIYFPNFNSYNPILLFTRANGDSLYTQVVTAINLGDIYGLAANEDGTFVAVGKYAFGPTTGAIFLAKFNQLGSLIWQRTFSVGAAGNRQKVIRLPDGYMIIGDYFFDIIKTDLDGNLVWQKQYGFPQSTGGQNLTPLPDGSYLATGWTTRGSLTSVSGFHKLNYWLVKMRPNGDTIFTKVLGNPGNFEIGYAAAPTPDGGVAVAGAYVANVSQTKRQGQVLKLDSLFNLQWDIKVMPTGGNYENGCEFFSIQPGINNNISVSGYFIDTFVRNYFAVVSPPSTPTGSPSILWDRKITEGTSYDMIYHDDGSAIVAGTGGRTNVEAFAARIINLPLPYRPNFCASQPRAQFSYQVRPDSVIFSNAQASASGLRYGVISKWEYLFGDGSNLVTYSAAAAKRVAHKYSIPVPLLQGTPVKLVVTNNLFCTDTLTLYPFGGGPTGLTEATASQVQVTVYPQPLQEQSILELKNYQGTEKLQLQITDLLGRTVQLPQQQVKANQWHLQKGSLSPGLYLYRIAAPNKLVAQGKLLVR